MNMGKGMDRLVRIALGLMMVASTLVAVVLPPSPASAASFTVNTVGDAPDVVPGNGVCESATPGDCSLRAALQEANALAGSDTIGFNIPGGGVQTIVPTTPLPAITDPVTINGYTQPGSAANTSPTSSNATLTIQISGGVATGSGLVVSSPSTVRGLAITGFTAEAILASATLTLEGNFVGIAPDGTTAAGSGRYGVRLLAGTGSLIGGGAVASRNVISGNTDDGVFVTGTALTTVIRGNLIGTDRTGTLAVPNLSGVCACTFATTGNTTIDGNVLSGNIAAGVYLAANATVITANLIGTAVSGLSALANGRGGVVSGFDSTNTQIGNGSVSGRNIISGNLSEGGVSLGASTELNTTVFGNYIGVGSDGVTPIPNSRGVWVFTPGATNIRIGSPTANTGNVIANNTGDGVWVQAGVGTSVRNNVMRGNGGEGILLGTGPTNPAPDLGDADTGANNLQNPPIVIRYAIQLQNVGSPVTLFTLASDSIPGNAVYPLQIDIYNSTNNLSGAAGTLITSFALSEFARNGDQLAYGGIAFSNPSDQIKLTITDANGNTSPFSPPFTVTESVEVNSTGDAPDANPADGVCSTSTPGECTLRAAIASAAVSGPTANITFATPSPATITPLTPYPPLRNSIDAGTRSSCRTSPPTLRVAIDASALAGDVFAIPSGVNNLFIRGLAIGGMGGSAISATDNSGTVVNCTFLGTDIAGVPNSSSTAPRVVLTMNGATPGDITVGGPAVYQRNLIVGFTTAFCPAVRSRLDVVNNDINTTVDGLAPASGTTLGAAVATNCNGTVADNRIAFGSPANGISIVGGGVVKVRRNNIIGPGATGIVSPEPAPVLSAAQMTAGLTRVVGTLASGVPNATFAIDVFNSSLCGAIGQRYVGTFDVTADAAGNASFDETVPGGAGVGFEHVTVTATDLDPSAHATSPFSACQLASALVSSISLDLEVATGAPTTVAIARNGIRVADLDRGIVSGSTGASSVVASSISAIGPEDTALAAITIGATPLRAIVLGSTPLRAISLVDIDVNQDGGGGWATLLAGTDLENVPLVNLTFGDALSNVTVSNRIAALPLRAIDVDGTPLRAIPIAAIALGSTPLRAIPLRAIAPGEPNPWCAIIATLLQQSGQTCDQALDSLNLMEITLRGVPLRAIPLRAIPLRAIDLAASPLRAIPLRAIDLAASPLRAIPLRAIDLEASPLRAIPLRAIPLRAVPLRAIDLGTTPLRAIDVDSTPLRAIVVEGLSVDGTPLRAIPLRAIPLRAIDLETSPLRAIPLRAIPLRAIPLRAIDLAASPLRAIPLRAINIAGSPLASIPLRAINLQTSPLRAIPLRAIPLRAIPLRAIPLRAITVQGTPLRAIPLRAIDILGSPLRAIPLRAITTVGAVNCQLVDCSKATLGDAFTAGALPATTTLGDILDAATGIRLGDIASSFNNFTEADLAAAIAASDHTLAELTTLDDLTLGDLPTDRAEFATVTLSDLGAALSTVTVGDLIGRATNPSTGHPYTEAELEDTVAGWTTTVGDLADPGTLTIGDLLDVAQGQVYLGDLGSLLDYITVDQLTSIVGPSLLAQIQAMTTQLGDLTDAQLGKMTLLDLGAAANDITIQQLLAGLGAALDSYTLGDLLLAMVDPGSLAYGGVEFDTIDEGTLPAGTVGATTFSASFAMTAPGSRNVSVEVVLPVGASYVAGSAVVSGTAAEPVQVGQTLQWSTSGPGNGAPIAVAFDVLPPLRLGATSLTATATIVGTDVSASSSATVTVAEGSEPNDFALSAGPGSPRQTTPAAEDTVYLTYIPTPTDIDVYEIHVAENDRLNVQLSNLDADLDVVVWGRPDAAAAAALGPVSGEAPLVPLADPDGGAADAALADDFVRLDALDPTLGLVASSNTPGSADETISTDRLPAGTYFVQVYGANGATNVAPASLQLKVREADALPPCRATGPLPAASAVPSVPTIPAAANTLILVNPSRLEQLHGASGRTAVNAAIGRLTTYLVAHPELGVNPVVVPVDAYPQIRAAYDTWDSAAGSCNPDAANAVVAAINAQIINPRRAQFDHIVVLGGDELIPMARVADATKVANEYEFRNEFDGDLRGGASNARNAATAALWESMILTDEPYGEASARSTGDGYLYVSDAALGRVVETPAEIADALDTFVQFGGNLSIQSATVLGYDFLADGSQAVADELAGGGLPVDRQLAGGLDATGQKWDAADATAALVQAGTRALVSLNAHFDHYRALPAAGDQVPGFDDNLIAAQVEATLGPDALNQSLVFSMGCHGGLSVSDIMVSSTNRDWAQSLTRQGSLFVGNTGFGYGDTESVAYTEELMRLFADRVTSPFALPNGPSTSSSTVGQALTWAKNAFVAGVHSYSAYDEKAVMESTFYGLPFYRVGLTPAALPPTPTRTASLDGTGTSTSSVIVTPANTTVVTPSGSYPANNDAAGNETVIVAPGRPIQPKVVEDISVVATSDSTELAKVAHGAIVERMTSVYSVVTNPVIATPVFDASASRPEPDAGDVAFPTKPLEITTTTGPSGTRQQLVLATGQYRSDGNVQRLDNSIATVVYYADPSATDFTAPIISAVGAEIVGRRVAISATVTDAASSVDRVHALVVENPGSGPAVWVGVDLVRSGTTSRWTGSLGLAATTTDVEFIVQAKDGAGNVGIATNKAHSFDADRSPAPPAPPAAVLSAVPATAPGASGIYAGAVQIVVTTTTPATYSIDGVAIGPVPGTGRFSIAGEGFHSWAVSVP
jgi:CSLREA domain-containing protein